MNVRAQLQTLGFLGLAVAGLGVAHLAQLHVDDERLSDETRWKARVMPDPSALRAAAMGEPTALADFLWVSVALTFAELAETAQPDGPGWLLAMLESVIALDPGWRTAYFYGGSMMRVLGDIDASDAIFSAGSEALPQDPYFPFSIGMNAYLYREDPARAMEMLDRAAGLPGAPAWYRSAAAGFLDEQGQRQAALDYLEQQMRVETEPKVLEALQRKYDNVLHDELSDRITQHLRATETRLGRPVQDIAALGDLPQDPLDGAWVIAPDRVVRSSVAEERLAESLRARERAMLTRPLP